MAGDEDWAPGLVPWGMEQPSPGPSPSRPSVSVTDRVSSARESLGGLSLFDDEDLADLAGSDDGLLDFPELPVEETSFEDAPAASRTKRLRKPRTLMNVSDTSGRRYASQAPPPASPPAPRDISKGV